MGLGWVMTRFSVIVISTLLCMGSAMAQNNNRSQQPSSDAGRPSGPLIPPGTVTPLSGDGVTPLGSDYLGNAPDPTSNTFQNPPGFLPRGQDPIPDEGKPHRRPRSIPMTLPPASTGRQGLPPQTWALLTPRQQDMHRQAQVAAMTAPIGEGYVWSDSKRQGEVRVMGDRLFNNRPCRDFVHSVLIDGQRVDGYTTICK